MDEIPYEPGAYYIFVRGYNDFKRLFAINMIGTFFVIRAKSNLQFKAVKWIRRLPKNILSDCIGVLSGYYSEKKYPEFIRKVSSFDQEQQREYTFMINAMHLTAYQVAELYKNRWQIELFFKWLKQHL